ncbi:hypothetical protein diail_5123 [Diaporthe ilicicola]|nr:hypothetical protein diail_5123 [Diaporthe ilicicola]
MPGGGWNGGDWSPDLPEGPSGYNGPDTTPPFHEWKHLSIDEQLKSAKDWRALHSRGFQPPGSSSASASASASAPTPDRSRAPPPPSTRAGPLAAAPKPPTAHPYLDNPRRSQRELGFGDHRTPGQSSATRDKGNGQAFNGQAFATRNPGAPQGVPTQSVAALCPHLDPATASGADTFAPVADHPVSVPDQHQSVFERESSFDEDYQRWESEVVYGQSPVPTGHVLVPRVPAPGRPTTPLFVSSPPPPARTRNDPQSTVSQAVVSHPAPANPLHTFERLSIRNPSERASPEIHSSLTAHPAPSVVQAPKTEDQPSSPGFPNHPVATHPLPGLTETRVAIGSNSVHPEAAGELLDSTTGIGAPSDDPATQTAIREVEARIEELEFQPLTAPVKEPSPPPPSDTEAVSRKTAKNRAKKAKQRERNKAKKAVAAAAPAPAEAEESTGSDTMKDDGKRKATEDPASPAAAKRVKHDDSADPPPAKPKMAVIPFPEKPAQLEERAGDIQFRVVNNDGDKDSFIIMTGLKCIFQKQLPKMPKDYIARLVYDRTHVSIAIVKKPLEVVGGITYRPFNDRKFAEIVFCAISSDQQVKGYGAHLMAHLKDYVKATSPVMHFLTYADNYAIGYFKKQGFTKEITLDKSVWMGYIKDYEGGTIMQCTMLERVRYLEVGRMLQKQKECVLAKIRAYSNSHVVHQPPKQWKNGPSPIDPMKIDAIKNSGWSPEMDELARQPRHGPNYNQLLHLLNDMQNHQSAWPFLMPVNKDDVHDYYDVIKEPMDLSTMEQKLEMDQYTTPEDFTKDATLIFKNCRQYNSEGTPYTKSANKLEKFMWSKIKEIPEWSHLAENQGK